MIRVGVVGAGYWGPNLARNFSLCPSTKLVALCDLAVERLEKLGRQYPGVSLIPSFDDLLGRADVDAVAIATPVRTHYPLAKAALLAGKHVLVEKPLAASVAQAEELDRLADERGLVLMTDHTFVFSPAVRRMKGLLDTGEIGDVYFLDSVRINLGLFQHDVNVVWDLAPHDLSIADYLLGRSPLSVSALGSCHIDVKGGIEDLAYVNLDYGDGLLASLHLSWLSPVKVRQFILGGSKKSIVYNDLESAEKLKVYDRGVTVRNEAQRQRAQIDYRMGDVWSPHLEPSEPLQSMVQHFAACVQNNAPPITGGAQGLRLVRILEAIQSSIKKAGTHVQLPPDARRPGPADAGPKLQAAA